MANGRRSDVEHGSYDPATGLLYWGVGNPSPNYSADVRPGDNLFIALHANTGKLAWYFQFTPHDEHDWDSAQTPVLADLLIGGLVRKVICWPNRNGFYYVLDRVTGEFSAGVPFVELDWAKGLIASIAIPLMDLFYGVNQGRNVIGFRAGFADAIGFMANENNALLDELKATERYKLAMKKYGLQEAK